MHGFKHVRLISIGGPRVYPIGACDAATSPSIVAVITSNLSHVRDDLRWSARTRDQLVRSYAPPDPTALLAPRGLQLKQCVGL